MIRVASCLKGMYVESDLQCKDYTRVDAVSQPFLVLHLSHICVMVYTTLSFLSVAKVRKEKVRRSQKK